MPSSTDNTALKIDHTDEQAVLLQDYKAQLDALNRTRARIEFELDGTIITANDLFLKTMGYTLEEVKGQRHGMFVEPAERQGLDYKGFWDRLARGEDFTGEFRRFAKGGREIWIQGSYTPIFDDNGKAVKVVKYAADITETVRARETNADFANQIATISRFQAVIEFKLDGTIVEANENFLNAMGYSMEEIRGKHHSMFVDPAERSTNEYREFWEKLGRGEYQAAQYRRVTKTGKDIWLQASYNPINDINGNPVKVVKFASDISAQRELAERVKEISNVVSSAASEMRATAESMARTASESTQQASAVASAAEVASANVQTVSAASEELSASISEIARQVTESTNITQRAVTETDKTRAAIQSLAEAAQKIGNVVTLINNIAGQTKLLALNATIEAARAGDAGKGFAVVASEVKSLSDQTAKATHEISSEVSAMQAATATSVSAIEGIADTIGKVAEIASAIASAVEEQSAATGEISANVTEAAASTREVTSNIIAVNEGVAQTSAASAQLLQASGELAVQSEALSNEMDKLLK